jgi:hypothetical protein
MISPFAAAAPPLTPAIRKRRKARTSRSAFPSFSASMTEMQPNGPVEARHSNFERRRSMVCTARNRISRPAGRSCIVPRCLSVTEDKGVRPMTPKRAARSRTSRGSAAAA